jgi:chloramphenicol 3-O phosphotransferase
VPTDVIVLNGGSSSGKTTIAHRLQEMLPGIWLSLGVDDLIAALPASSGEDAPIALGANGSVLVRESFRRAEAAWWAGVAAIARSGVGVIVDDAFLGGAASQARFRAALTGLDVLWVGVRCPAEVAARRETGRAERIPGMAASQADLVHNGVGYDFEVDTAITSAAACAAAIRARVMAGPGAPSAGCRRL